MYINTISMHRIFARSLLYIHTTRQTINTVHHISAYSFIIHSVWNLPSGKRNTEHFIFSCREGTASDISQHEVAKRSESPNSFLDQECRQRFPMMDEDAILYCYEYDPNRGPPPVRRDGTMTYGTCFDLLSPRSRLKWFEVDTTVC